MIHKPKNKSKKSPFPSSASQLKGSFDDSWANQWVETGSIEGGGFWFHSRKASVAYDIFSKPLKIEIKEESL